METKSEKNILFNKLINLLPLIFVCIATIWLAVPTLNYNVNDPNLITYFDGDEGYRMDVIWKHYSGEIRDSYKGDYQYGLLEVYLADFARTVLSHFIDFTPGTFVLILRWLHLIFWAGSLIMLWRLVIYHFNKRWQAILAVTVLATRPAFFYFMHSLKPDPIVLFFVIIGLDYTLRIIDEPSKRNLFLAVACSSLAFVVKFSGIFLLPAIITAMALSERYRDKEAPNFLRVKNVWTLYLFIGLVLIFLPALTILFYARQLTGLTWYEQFGFWGSLLQNKLVFYLILGGTFFIFISLVIWALGRKDKLKKPMGVINELSSHAFIVLAMFLGLTLLFGFRWLIVPRFFLISYFYLVPFAVDASLNAIAEKGLLLAFFYDFFAKIKEFGLIIVILFIFYMITEIALRRQSFEQDRLRLFKRLVLLSFILPFFLFIILTMTRAVQLHMLPFIAAMLILSFQGIGMVFNRLRGTKGVKRAFLYALSFLIAMDVLLSGRVVFVSFLNKYHQREDIVFDLAKWWRENIPLDASIVSDHHTRVYIPPEYKNIKVFKGYQDAAVEQLRRLVDIYHPQFIYYNDGAWGGEPLPPIEKMLPGRKVELVKSFDSRTKRYRGSAGHRLLIYKVLY